MSSEITYEERERIIKELKDPENESKDVCEFSLILDNNRENCDDITCRECSKIAREKILALIESAPAKKNMRAVELADKLEKGFISIGYDMEAIGDALGYDGRETSLSIDMRHLVDAIRNLDEPEDGMKWPLDKDGVEIKPGDTVYAGEDKYEVAYIEYGTIGAGVRLVDSSSLLLRNPRDLTHKKPRTLNDIKEEAYESHRYLVSEEYKMSINELINEAYEMGKAAGNEEASEV